MTKTAQLISVIAFGLLSGARPVQALTLQRETLQAWQHYVELAQARFNSRLGTSDNFLWLDDDPKRPPRLRQGQIETAPIQKDDCKGHDCNHVPNGLIHDWMGAVFIPQASLDQVLSILTNYDRYTAVYNPQVVEAKLLAHTSEWDEFSMKLVNRVLFVNAGIDIQCRAHTVRLDDRRAYSAFYTTRVQDLLNYGRPDESELTPDTGDGFIWRLYTTTRCVERDGGVYLEMETMALTRDIPGSMNFLLAPLVKKLARNSLTVSLEKTRDAVRTPVEMAKQPLEGFRPGSSAATAHANSLLQQH